MQGRGSPHPLSSWTVDLNKTQKPRKQSQKTKYYSNKGERKVRDNRTALEMAVLPSRETVEKGAPLYFTPATAIVPRALHAPV